MDSFSLRIGNLLVSNAENEACLEITVVGPRIVALIDTEIAVTGADLYPHINADPLKMWCSHFIRKGEVLSFKGLRNGCRAYLAVTGGIHVKSIMGSKSTNLSAGFGGFEGRSLRAGDILFSNPSHCSPKTETWALQEDDIPADPADQSIRVIFGPQDDHFPSKTREIFLDATFRVTPQSDRTGIRLAGPPIEAKKNLGKSIISEGVVPGTIQIPGDAQPIIILGETVTGGYRKIATIASADLPFLGQVKPGDTVNFHRVSIDEAYQAIREQEKRINKLKEKMRAK